MSRFVPMSTDEFADVLAQTILTRRIDAVHLHHTWRPNHAQWRGEDSVEGMWRFHVKTNGWSDIAQHVTIAPDGIIWSGRGWNLPPASAKGFNGNATVGPFMIEMAGDFDEGRDRLVDPQLSAVIQVIARVQQKFQLPPETLRFHRMMTDQKSCPGTAIDHQAIVAMVRQAHVTLASSPATIRAPRPSHWAKPGFAATSARVAMVVEQMRARSATKVTEAFDAELPESNMSAEEIAIVTGLAGVTRQAPSAARDDGRAALTPAMLAELRAHVINLNEGRFSGQGILRTEAGDVDAIFQTLGQAAAQASSNDPLRIVLWAHGGLIDEASGLWIAHQQVQWWKANDVYPIFFVWETGFLDALRQILGGSRAAAARDLTDATDAVIAKLARRLGGGKIWSAMKRSAELAVASSGGARYVAEKLRAFVQTQAAVELHAVGHSAGSIFHAHFLSTALGMGVPAVRTLQLLAPAIRSDLFKEKLVPRVGPGNGIDELTMFTMSRDWEEADSVARIYRKSLLYLIRQALEGEEGAAILGLEECVRGDQALVRLFGLDGASAVAQVVWSVTETISGRSASTSSSHGGFDNDRATMDSVATRILRAQPKVTFPDAAIERGLASWNAATTIPEPMGSAPASTTWSLPGNGNGLTAGPAAPGTAQPFVAVHPNGNDRRLALCVGINAYAGQPLSGCVADAQQWQQALTGLGFDCTTLFDQQARRQAMIDALHELIATRRPGDVVVFQYAGHGTHLDDLDGDETDGQDEALCPFDIDQGAYLIDDDIAAVMAAIPAGVNVTCFLDCCHSGTATRFAVGPAAGARGGATSRARFLQTTAAMQEQHRAFRARGGLPTPAPGRSEATMRNVVFAACQDHEVAWETGGHGEFTVHTLGILSAGFGGMSHEQVEGRVRAAFGPNPRQSPRLDCAREMRSLMLFEPLDGTSAASTGRGRSRGGADQGDLAHALAEGLRGVADIISERR